MKIDAPLRSQFPALRRLWQEAFGDTENFLNDFGVTAFSTDRCRCVTVEGTVAAVLYWFDCMHMNTQVAYLYAVATAKTFHGQGICHKLMEDTHHHLTKLGYEGTILVPGNKKLFQLYESMGYQTCCQIQKFCCTSGSSTIPLRCIDKTEYATLRRQLLPEGGIIQEKENLDFLQTLADFYAGDDFLLAARGEGDTLYGVELLGDETAAPEIVHALGYTKGTFRTPGGDIPFAMYHPLGKSKLTPAYFGLAFD